MSQDQIMGSYLIHIQYLGFRFHGWQRQPGVKTLESMVVKTLDNILGSGQFRILGTSRTDAMVSASHTAFQLFPKADLGKDHLLAALNLNLPPDIRALAVETVGPGFNIINSPRSKTYHYYFCCGQKAHPFCAPLLTSFREDLDIETMAKGAALFEGTHDFGAYCTRPGPGTRTIRTVDLSRIEENQEILASFFPETTWVYQVRSRGFMRNQVRLMVGQLVRLGRREICLSELAESLTQDRPKGLLDFIAPASGLVLHQVTFTPAALAGSHGNRSEREGR